MGNSQINTHRRQGSKRSQLRPLVLAIACGLAAASAQAFEIATDNEDLSIRWDNTVKYSAAYRLQDADSRLTAAPFSGFANTDDGDRNFRNAGVISNRLDLLSELDVVYKKNYGFRVSGAAWYDSVYNGGNDNDSAATSNNVSVANNEFTDGTKKLHGQDAELLDAFVFGKADLAGMPLTARLGRHTVLWGESLFFGGNGIANAMAPIDVVKAMSVPNTKFQELMRPVNQLSSQLQITPDVALGMFYKLEWDKTRLPGAGSYFSGIDMLSDGAESIYVPGLGKLDRASDIEAKDSGQGGVSLRMRSGDVDYGLYAARYHETGPQIYILPVSGQYRWVYPEGVKTFGASASTTFENVNVAAEVSVRHNTPLASDAQIDVTGTADNSDNALYAIGKSAHAQVNWLASLGPSWIAREADFLGEIAWNRMTSITKNASALNPNATRDATNIRVVYEPKYRQVLPGLDLSVPIGIGYGLSGNSAVVASFNGEKVGDLSIGVNGTYLDDWRFGLSYTHYFGPVDNGIDANGHGSYKQNLADRDYIALSVRRTF
ncbi:DUF1302 domain-containing protein [Vogesella facilis]|uniref:DUF1302 domain-containing protein n=1 Tax=Vogesella facilis TaxID=1655232 RepID=A0ABV7RED2_9NEIS